MLEFCWVIKREEEKESGKPSVALFEDFLSVYVDPSNWMNFKVPVQLCNSLSQPLIKDLTLKMDILQTRKSLERVSPSFLFLATHSSTWKHEDTKTGKSENQKRINQVYNGQETLSGQKMCCQEASLYKEYSEKLCLCSVKTTSSYMNSHCKQASAQRILMK